MCLGAGSLASHVVTTEALCEKIPNGFSFEEAATVPAMYATAIAALFNTAKLERGQVGKPRSAQILNLILTIY